MDTSLAVVAQELFGDALDPRELSDLVSKANDASEMHVPKPLKAVKPEKVARDISQTPRWQQNVALATNAAGAVAGPAAIAMAVKQARAKKGGMPTEGLRHMVSHTKGKSAVGRAARGSLKFVSQPKMLALGGVTAVGLQTANWAGDAIAARAFAGQRQKENKFKEQREKNKDIHIKKALGDIVQARRDGVISTDTAVRMSAELMDTVSKFGGEAKTIHQEAMKLVPMASDPAPKKSSKLKMPKPAVPNRKPMAPLDKNPVDVVKSDSPDLVWTGTISKVDDEKRQVFGYCTVTHVNGEAVVDRQGDYVPLDEIEKAAYTYVVQSRKGGDMHARDGEQPLHTSDMIESFIVTPEKLEKMGLEPNAVPHGWWVGFQVNDDEQWAKVKNKERTAFSIHGSGRRVEKMMES